MGVAQRTESPAQLSRFTASGPRAVRKETPPGTSRAPGPVRLAAGATVRLPFHGRVHEPLGAALLVRPVKGRRPRPHHADPEDVGFRGRQGRGLLLLPLRPVAVPRKHRPAGLLRGDGRCQGERVGVVVVGAGAVRVVHGGLVARPGPPFEADQLAALGRVVEDRDAPLGEERLGFECKRLPREYILGKPASEGAAPQDVDATAESVLSPST
jgi:hypothetical protein